MSFGQNIQFLRKMRNKMTQEELAEKLSVSRQTISKWEMNASYPEMDKVIEICKLFSCSMDELIREDMNVCDDAYSEIRREYIGPMNYVSYSVISTEPENDAISHMEKCANRFAIENPQIIGWNFPMVSQEQVNVYNMHGYTAALILPHNMEQNADIKDIIKQDKLKYIALTIKNHLSAPFRLIPNAYKILMTHMHVNGLSLQENKNIISCFEKEYEIEGIPYMDVYIVIEDKEDKEIEKSI